MNSEHQGFSGFSNEQQLLPAGLLQMYAGITVPSGWLECDGRTIGRAQYPALFKAIGITWGIGDGSTTFNLPDLRGRSPIGAGTGLGLSARSLAQTGGEEAHTLTTGELAAHSHTITDPGHAHDYVARAGLLLALIGLVATDATSVVATTDSSTTGITVNSAGGDVAHNNMQPFSVLKFIIKY